MTAYEKSGEVISAIRRYEYMRDIVVNTPSEIKEQYDRLSSPRSAKIDGMPKVHNSHAGEERLCNGIDLINSMEERYRKAQIFVAWFEPMWKALSEEERQMLETYKHTDVYDGALALLAEELRYSPRQLRRYRQRVLNKLVILLYGD